MEQQEIDRIKAECDRITREFRDIVSQQPALDENGLPRMVNGILDKPVQLSVATGKQVQEYVANIQKILDEYEEIALSQRIQGFIIDLSNLYIPEYEYIEISGNIPSIICRATRFRDVVNFNNAKFNGSVNFDNAQFDNAADFKKVIFNAWANFKGTIFNAGANFKETAFLAADFKDARFNSLTDFNKATFLWANFDNAIFKNVTYFSNTSFNNAPTFHNTELHQNTSFEGAEFVRCEWEEDYRAYRTLKQHMNDVHATLEESRFFALEQRTRLKLDEELYRQGKEELLSNIIISKFYAGISDYGQDTLRPLLLLAGMWLLFGLLFSLPHMVEVNPEYSKIAWIAPFNDSNWFINIIKGLGYSFQSTFNPLSLFAKDIPFVAQNIIVLILAYIELLCAITFIALWLFAVRRRFQKGE